MTRYSRFSVFHLFYILSFWNILSSGFIQKLISSNLQPKTDFNSSLKPHQKYNSVLTLNSVGLTVRSFATLTLLVQGLARSLRSFPLGKNAIPEYVFTPMTQNKEIIAFVAVSTNTPFYLFFRIGVKIQVVHDQFLREATKRRKNNPFLLVSKVMYNFSGFLFLHLRFLKDIH